MAARKVTMTFKPSVLVKLDQDRGDIPRSTYVAILIKRGEKINA